MTKKPFKKKQHKREFIDFRTLDNKGLRDLTYKWEQDARIFEAKLQKYMSNPKANEEKVERLWNTGKALWRRVEILERWKLRNNKVV